MQPLPLPLLSEEARKRLHRVFIILMPLAMIITPIPMGTRVQSDYIKGWMVAVFMCKQTASLDPFQRRPTRMPVRTDVLTQGVAEYGMRPTPLGVLKVVGKTVLGFAGFGLSMAPSML